MIITIDGPASSGKGTLAKKLAKKLNYVYLDTGALYRTLTLYCLTNDIDIYDEQAVALALKQLAIHFDTEQHVFLNEADVTDLIRTEEVSKYTSSPISTYEQVRTTIVEKERVFAQNQDIIVDGRDSGTVVFPEADIKLFISASLEERAQRRFKQNQSLGLDTDYQQVLAELALRDRNDILRPLSPLQIAEDGIVVDTTNMNAQEALDYVYELVVKNMQI